MQAFLEYIIKNIVKNPQDVIITHNLEGTVNNYTIKVNTQDMGILIGKGGKTIKSIREMAIAKAIVDKSRINITIDESNQKTDLSDLNELDSDTN